MILAALSLALGCSHAVVQDGPAADASAPRVELTKLNGDGAWCLEVLNVAPRDLANFAKLAPDDRRKVFELFVAGDLAEPPPVLGETSVVADRLRFIPRFPLAPGLRYKTVFTPALLAPQTEGSIVVVPISGEVTVPKLPAGPPTGVTYIYPTADVLPENQLKFYIHFSAPMRRGDAYRHIHLLDHEGKEVEAPFLELSEELWDGDMQRFTLLCDPGRVKRGLKPREEFGPVLVEGKRFTLSIDRAWSDAGGNPLAEPAQKAIQVTAPDDTPIDPAMWKIEPPAAASQGPLVVHFGEPLDAALATRVIRVENAAGERIAGSVKLIDHERSWEFHPAAAWQAGHYKLVAETTLEDLAGNAIGRAFEVDEFKPITQKIEANTVAVPFEVGKVD